MKVQHITGTVGDLVGTMGNDVGVGMAVVKVGFQLAKWPFHEVNIYTDTEWEAKKTKPMEENLAEAPAKKKRKKK